ncbi:uncharacterized protein GGS25DRAFT_522973 [Hypoxylon fragiforme]|uniref:uncharacterized protein n=1 Tax=Hypoxylon fragiforme TaxID=63214 RepID=UPI0020C5BE6B|nr:uncharacterized protein GGS25DRAFT_522973 [Hypoxylon fragiforme]KAI2607452.1 hypothetical protein GGS25DRAFT_522973 [Hypoxylon fragiforme]
MANFFAALLAAAAMLQVGSAVPFPFTNGTAPAIHGVRGITNTTAVSPQVLKRRLRDFPIALIEEAQWATTKPLGKMRRVRFLARHPHTDDGAFCCVPKRESQNQKPHLDSPHG